MVKWKGTEHLLNRVRQMQQGMPASDQTGHRSVLIKGAIGGKRPNFKVKVNKGPPTDRYIIAVSWHHADNSGNNQPTTSLSSSSSFSL